MMRPILIVLVSGQFLAACGGSTNSGTGQTSAGGGGGSPGTGGSGAGIGGMAAATGGSAGANGGATAAGGSAAGSGGVLPSCGDGTTTCAPAGPSCSGGLACPFAKNCCESIVVPGGDFLQSSITGPETTSHPTVHVESFALDTFKVTVGRFRAFVAAYDGTPPLPGAGSNPSVPMTGWRAEWANQLPKTAASLRSNLGLCAGIVGGAPLSTWTDDPGDNEMRPIGCVNWYEAFAFCAWDGGRLPGGAEWEYAAAGADQQRLYPWGSAAPDNTKLPATCQLNTPTDVASVGLFAGGAARWGQLDMKTASVGEWEFDCLPGGKAWQCPSAECTCLGVQPFDSARASRGGGCVADPNKAHAASVPTGFDAAYHISGFRCARTPM